MVYLVQSGRTALPIRKRSSAQVLVLHDRWRSAFGKRPCVVRELRRQESVLLARCPYRSQFRIEEHLCRARIGTTIEVSGIRTGTPCRYCRWVVVRDFPRTNRIRMSNTRIPAFWYAQASVVALRLLSTLQVCCPRCSNDCHSLRDSGFPMSCRNWPGHGPRRPTRVAV
jgi:hypothetical protein